MDWDAIGAIGEIVGAGAVVLSLVYLATQIRSQSSEARATTTQAALDAEMVFQTTLIRHADVWEEVVMGGDTSDGIRTRRAIAMYNMVMTLMDNQFRMSKAGYLEFSDGGLRQMAMLPFYDVWRPSTGAASRSPEFLEYLETMRREGTEQ